MIVKCPLCEGKMSSQGNCPTCGAQIDSKSALVRFYTPLPPEMMPRMNALHGLKDNYTVDNYKTTSPIFPDSINQIVLDRVLYDCFQPRLLQLVRIGADLDRLLPPTVKDPQVYLFERYMLINRKEFTPTEKKVIAMMCSPTLEEKVDRIWKVFDGEPPEKTDPELFYSFVLNPIGKSKLPTNDFNELLQFYEKNLLMHILEILYKMEPMKRKSHLDKVRQETEDLYFSVIAGTAVNGGHSALVADKIMYIQLPAVNDAKLMNELIMSCSILKEAASAAINSNYRKRYGIDAKKAKMKEWGVTYNADDDAALRFWHALFNKIRTCEIEKR